MLDQRRRRWADVVQMLYKGFVFAGWASLNNLSILSIYVHGGYFSNPEDIIFSINVYLTVSIYIVLFLITLTTSLKCIKRCF